MSYDRERAREHFQAKTEFTTGTHEVLGIIDQGRDDIVIVDVRLPSDYRAGHIPGAINLPKGRWENARGLSQDKASHSLLLLADPATWRRKPR